MPEEIKKQIERLESLIINSTEDSDYVGSMYDITDELEKLENANEAIGPLLQLIEKYPDFDFGAPGPIAHFMEKFNKRGYDDLLLASLKRNPNSYSVFLLHRIINDKNNSNRGEYIELLRGIARNASLDTDTIASAKESLEYFE